MENNVCAHCGRPIDSVYYSVNEKKICPVCAGISVSELMNDGVIELEDLSVESTGETVEDEDSSEYVKSKAVLSTAYGMKVESVEYADTDSGK